MDKLFQDIFSILYNLFTDKNFYIPLMAVVTAWILSFIPQKRQNIQQTIFELMKNQMDLLNRIDLKEYKGVSFFIYAKRTLKRLYDFVSKSIEDVSKDPTDYYSNPLNSAVLEFEDTICGRNSLKVFYRNRPIRKVDEEESQYERRKAEHVYEYFFETHYFLVGHYFKHLYNIIKYIKRNRIWIINTRFYTGLIQAQMSAPELYVLFYNGLLFKRMKRLINRYKLIENLAKQDLMKFEHHKFYECKMKDRKELNGEVNEDVDIFIDKPTIKKEFEEKLNDNLSYLSEIIHGIKVKKKEGNNTVEYIGLEYFSYLKTKFRQYYLLQIGTDDIKEKIKKVLIDNGYTFGEVNKIITDSPIKSDRELDYESSKKLCNYTFGIIYYMGREHLDKYFNQILYILKYLERMESYIKKYDSEISEYINFFQGRLSSTELFLLFYSGLHFPEIKEYLEKYNLFLRLTSEDLMEQRHQLFYIWK